MFDKRAEGLGCGSKAIVVVIVIIIIIIIIIIIVVSALKLLFNSTIIPRNVYAF